MFAQTADELLAAFRDDVNDAAQPYLWSDPTVYRYMTVACDRLATKTKELYKLITLNYTAGATSLTLPQYVLEIREARIVGGDALHQRNANEMTGASTDDYGHRTYANVAFDQVGRPASFVRDYDKAAIRLVPKPDADGAVELQCTVTVASPMEPGADLPFTSAEDQLLLLEGMKALAYRKHDAETEDLVRARAHEEAFERGLHEREWRLHNYRRNAGVVRMDGW